MNPAALLGIMFGITGLSPLDLVDSTRRYNKRVLYYNAGFFPKIARGHSAKCFERCLRAKLDKAHYKNDSYVDGHFQTQSVAERAHREGIR